MNKAEILMIDDEPQVRRLLQIALENQQYHISQAATGKEGIIMAANHPPDLILLDIGLPDQSGHEVLRELRTWYQKAIIILSVQDNETDIVKALDNGANDYLTKPFRMGELLARIRSSLRTSQSEPNGDTAVIIGELQIDFVARTVRRGEQLVKLTATEYNLLAFLAKNIGRVLTHQHILKNIWGISYQTETQYLRVFVAQLRKKIEINPNQPQYIVTESGVGYRFG
jgi:two-component system, OmpR family, KDP operon response regulator KdpE